MPANILVTGAAGFIGYHVCERLLARGDRVIGVDSLSAYYDVGLKRARLARLTANPRFEFWHRDLADRDVAADVFATAPVGRVVHLAAQPGVRHSIASPHTCAEANLTGFLNVLEGCRHARVEHLVFASSSSVYGANTAMPYAPARGADHPMSLYAATKKANEVMAHAYSSAFGLPVTGLRFFTVYGPWGRPDMALFLFTRALLAGDEIDLFNDGEMWRDFTYVDDVAEGLVRALDRPAASDAAWSGGDPNPATSYAPYRIYNIGNHAPVRLTDVIALLERHLGVRARTRLCPMQPGDVPATFADVSDFTRDFGRLPHTPPAEGVRRFVRWYRMYYSTAPRSPKRERPTLAGHRVWAPGAEAELRG
jgi:UDP-glucuronate 4-epimerase